MRKNNLLPVYLKIKSREIIYILLLVFSFFGTGCTNNSQKPLEISFYYWKQSFELSSEQENLLNSCGTKELYVKFFDVIVDPNSGEVKPISKIDFKQKPSTTVVPCVFIQNDVFKTKINLDTIARDICDLTFKIAKSNNINLTEIQIDCDWTAQTKQNYFAFLERIQTIAATISITPTIRLHQIKFKESAGIPPAKKGLLMCYNMGDIESFKTENSIVSNEVLQTYINEQTTYPVKLDLALPIYQWALLYRLGELTTIDNDIDLNELKNNGLKEFEPNKFQVLNFTTIKETEYCKGDLVKFEECNPSELLKCANTLKNSGLEFNKIIFYHISQNNLNKFNHEFFKEISRSLN
jgi:hypothetical protein